MGLPRCVGLGFTLGLVVGMWCHKPTGAGHHRSKDADQLTLTLTLTLIAGHHRSKGSLGMYSRIRMLIVRDHQGSIN